MPEVIFSGIHTRAQFSAPGTGNRYDSLRLESSCDETAVAVFDPSQGIGGEWIHSQIALHESYGGVVPDLARAVNTLQFTFRSVAGPARWR